MPGSSAQPAHRVLLPAAFVLLLIFSTIPTQAQLPEPDISRNHYASNIIPEEGSVTMPFQGAVSIPVTIEDASMVAREDQVFREPGDIYLSVEVLGNNTDGWTASITPRYMRTTPGEMHEVTLDIQSGATVEQSVVEVRIESVYQPFSGDEHQTNASVMAVVESFPRLSVLPDDYPDTFEPDDMQRVGITVTNNDIYPDMASLQVDAPNGWMVSPPSSVQLAPGESKIVYVDIKAPDNPWFLYTTKSEFISIGVVSENSGQQLVSTGVPISQTGSNPPAWIAGHMFMLFVGAALVTKRTARKVRDRRYEKGKPSYPGLDPEHEAEFEALKVKDPEEAGVLEERLETLYEQRKRAWSEAYERRQDAEEEVQMAYHERHEALVTAREAEEGADVDHELRRRRLLEKKRRLLERKRERVRREDSSLEGSSSSSDADASPGGRPS